MATSSDAWCSAIMRVLMNEGVLLFSFVPIYITHLCII